MANWETTLLQDSLFTHYFKFKSPKMAKRATPPHECLVVVGVAISHINKNHQPLKQSSLTHKQSHVKIQYQDKNRTDQKETKFPVSRSVKLTCDWWEVSFFFFHKRLFCFVLFLRVTDQQQGKRCHCVNGILHDQIALQVNAQYKLQIYVKKQ